MKIGSKYKIARRLGAPVFEKTQTAKFNLSAQKKKGQLKKAPKARSGFAGQLLEKQKMRFTYFISEKQFSKYVKSSIAQDPSSATNSLFAKLEKRLDSIVLRAGFCPTRFAARQAVSHGHFLVNGKRVNVPSYQISESDSISIREGSKSKGIFANLDEKIAEHTAPSWLLVDKVKKEIKIKGEPVYNATESNFDINAVIQFYKR